MDLPTLLKSHVYTAILLGSVVEGETTVVLGGFAAHQGYAPWWAVTLLAAVINFAWDQAYYALGRWRGQQVLEHWPRLRPGVERIRPLLLQHRRAIIFGVRFMYGLRTAGPLALGIARVSWREFIFYNALGAAAWSVTFSALGCAFGRTIAVVIGDLARFEMHAFAAILAGGAAWYAVHRLRHRHSDQPCPGAFPAPYRGEHGDEKMSARGLGAGESAWRDSTTRTIDPRPRAFGVNTGRTGGSRPPGQGPCSAARRALLVRQSSWSSFSPRSAWSCLLDNTLPSAASTCTSKTLLSGVTTST